MQQQQSPLETQKAFLHHLGFSHQFPHHRLLLSFSFLPSFLPSFPQHRCCHTSTKSWQEEGEREKTKMRPILMKGHERPLTFLKYNREGDLLFSCAKDHTPTVWFADDGERLGTYRGHNGAVWCCDVSRMIPPSNFPEFTNPCYIELFSLCLIGRVVVGN